MTCRTSLESIREWRANMTCSSVRSTSVRMRCTQRPVSFYVLLALVTQNASLILVSKYSFRDTAPPYSQKLVVLLAELLKFAACCLAEGWSCGFNTITRKLRFTKSNVAVLAPCLLYLVQNNLQLMAIQELPTNVYVVCSQLKTVTSAFFGVCILRKPLRKQQVLSILLLIAGVSMVQVEYTPSQVNSPIHTSGLISVIVACIFSGLAGTLLEKWYKQSGASLWCRNMFLSFVTLPAALLSMFTEVLPIQSISNFDSVVYLVIVLQAAGGLIVAGVMKFSSNLLKCFAVSISIILCSVAGFQLSDDEISVLAMVGTCLVIVSIWLFAAK